MLSFKREDFKFLKDGFDEMSFCCLKPLSFHLSEAHILIAFVHHSLGALCLFIFIAICSTHDTGVVDAEL